MKKLYTLILVTALVNSFGFAQSFVFSPTDNYEANIELNSYTNHLVYIENLTGEELSLGWERISVDMPEDWTITLCDYGGCHVGIPENGLMYPIFDTISAFLKLSINPNDLIATGTVTFKVYDTKHPEQFDFVTFTIHSVNVTGVQTVALESSFSVFPNPVSDKITISNYGFENATVSLVDILGKVVRQSELTNEQEVYNVSELEKGLYVIMISDQTGILEQKKIMIQ